ncbi:hypothetical protein DNU06_05020 [Putridiphycobacter roseus]|uniref:Tetratricopeptide repeat protein n=1 Tax=Putridiphycobacter roseus TaxID=2219161 RepID=A0A2W1NFW6_9FLAO|nr:tetratricopeptide repeat protein [Putridiphycobacter roseus]PZE17983.1 hypothetical protein DNU06_05020 [Putridiphycobacter roseus]
MAKKKNNTRAKVKEVSEDLTTTENFLDRNRKTIILLSGAILAVLVGYIGYLKFIKEPAEVASQEEIWNAFYAFENDSTQIAIDGTENFSGMEYIADKYKGTSGGDISNYAMGIMSMENGEFETALDYLDNCSFEDVMIGNLCIGLQGDCYVELGEYKKAAKYFQNAANREANEFTSPMFLKKAGLALEELGETSKANKLYTKIKTEYANSEVASDIDKYIGRTNS